MINIIYSADISDSFFELSTAELLDFQKSLQFKSKSLSDRPFMSAKEKFKSDAAIKETINLKIIFPDQIRVQVSFNTSFKGEKFFVL